MKRIYKCCGEVNVFARITFANKIVKTVTLVFFKISNDGKPHPEVDEFLENFACQLSFEIEELG